MDWPFIVQVFKNIRYAGVKNINSFCSLEAMSFNKTNVVLENININSVFLLSIIIKNIFVVLEDSGLLHLVG